MLYALLSILIIGVLFLILVISSKYKQEKKNKEEYIQKKKEKFDKEFREEDRLLREVKQQRTEFEKNYYQQKNNYTAILEERKKEVDSLIAQQNALVEQKQSDVDELVKQHYTHQQEDYERELHAVQTALQEDAEIELGQTMAKYYEEIFQLKHELDEYKAKRDAINEQILQQRAIEEKQDFYRVCITDQDLEDIKYLTSIMENIHHKETLNKLIWSEYLQQPFKKMLNNVLGNADPKNVIYKITNLNTNETYIGKTSGSVSNRWTEHIKTSLNIGTIKSAPIHKALYKNWSKFTFEVLEKVNSSENLGEHEKYWINFYQSTVYGYNVKSGG